MNTSTKQDQYILGLSAYHSNSSAALLKNGRLVGAIEEEKMTGRKYTGELPVKSIDFLFKQEGIGIQDIDHIAYFWQPFLGLHHRLWQVFRHFPGSLGFGGQHRTMWTQMVFMRDHLKRVFKLSTEPYEFHYLNHHLSHAASSFFMSDFKESAILTIDGSGERTNTMFSIGGEGFIRPIKQMYYPNSLGYLYASVTQFLGFKPNKGEGKVMGLASYGKPVYVDFFRKICPFKPNGEYQLDLSYFDYYRNGANIENSKRWVSDKFIEEMGPMRVPESKIDKRHEDIAASLQQYFNEVFAHMIDWLYEQTGSENLCLAGGVALNSVANGYAFRRSKFKRIYIQPSASDGGGSVGAALYLHNCVLKRPRAWGAGDIYIGPEYTDAEIRTALDKRGVKYQKVDPAKEAAKLLSEGKIIGWFQGKAEFGPRALGARSILADPRPAEMKDIINARVKFREPFRPFAPSILEDKLTEYFDFHHPAPSMLLVYDVLPGKRAVIPAVTHVDGSGRVQTVSKKDTPLYYELIEEFYKRTGVPVVLNTSFNIRGKPIVGYPEDAVECFMTADLDAMIIGDYLALKKPQNGAGR